MGLHDASADPLVEAIAVDHVYTARVVEPVPALRSVSLRVAAGEHLAILGANGSGKSTLARHFNALLLPSVGDVLVEGHNTKLIGRDLGLKKRIRAAVGLVFQNPDSQIVATIVEDDVAFGPENIGVPRGELRSRVDRALELVDMKDEAQRPPHMLSVGQRQRVAIAGALAMEPQMLIFDEATSMLDPAGRRAVMEIMERLHRQGVGVVQVTHHMEEAARAQRVVILEDGALVVDGPCVEVLSDGESLHGRGLDVPPTVRIAQMVSHRVPGFPTHLLTTGAVVQAVGERLDPGPDEVPPPPQTKHDPVPDHPVIEIEALSHTYLAGTPLEHQSLVDVSLQVGGGEVVAVVGHTGSGKSTLIQHLNGLTRPQAGRVVVAGFDLGRRDVDVRELRSRVGLLFQRPEDQLFERYVGDDVAFGPAQFGLGGDQLRQRARWAMDLMGVPFEEFKDRPIFALSGGEKRRVALAGVLAMRPQILVLDEPTAGLDPRSRDELLAILEVLRREEGITIVLVSHNMDEVAELADRVYVMAEGSTIAAGTPRSLFSNPGLLGEVGLGLPPAAEVAHRLREAGYALGADCTSEAEVAGGIADLMAKARADGRL
ncbi:MAG: energy-coupling factor transporter ATPase [Actinomycetota bacterium]|nr:energy-coupling factor transporter ATPase [Actinomycetota bacterium]